MPRVTLALGSNLGDRAALLDSAISALREIAVPGAPFLIATYLETDPLDCPPGSPAFLNTAVDFHFPESDPFALLNHTREIERNLGRTPSPLPNSPRTIDIDILLFGTAILNHPLLTIPHPRMRQRPFVMLPLSEIRPDLI